MRGRRTKSQTIKLNFLPSKSSPGLRLVWCRSRYSSCSPESSHFWLAVRNAVLPSSEWQEPMSTASFRCSRCPKATICYRTPEGLWPVGRENFQLTLWIYDETRNLWTTAHTNAHSYSPYPETVMKKDYSFYIGFPCSFCSSLAHCVDGIKSKNFDVSQSTFSKTNVICWLRLDRTEGAKRENITSVFFCYRLAS